MKLLSALLIALTLTGCASDCTRSCIYGIGPGNSAFDRVALHHDRGDPCQGGRGASPERRAQLGRPDNYEIPTWCGAGRGRTTIYSTTHRPIGYIR